jgi:hypothetical protein
MDTRDAGSAGAVGGSVLGEVYRAYEGPGGLLAAWRDGIGADGTQA